MSSRNTLYWRGQLFAALAAFLLWIAAVLAVWSFTALKGEAFYKSLVFGTLLWSLTVSLSMAALHRPNPTIFWLGFLRMAGRIGGITAGPVFALFFGMLAMAASNSAAVSFVVWLVAAVILGVVLFFKLPGWLTKPA